MTPDERSQYFLRRWDGVFRVLAAIEAAERAEFEAFDPCI